MWYGQQAFANVSAPTLEALVEKGYRPGDVQGSKKPPRGWKQVMNKCWQKNPEDRPTAKTCYEEVLRIVGKC